MKATEADHMASFEKLWKGLMCEWFSKLSDSETAIYSKLVTDNERDAFRIIRSYARKAKIDDSFDFHIVRENLASRLGITGPGAGKIRDKLAELGAIARTAKCKENVASARYRWIPELTLETLKPRGP
jgi:hypothetical protein